MNSLSKKYPCLYCSGAGAYKRTVPEHAGQLGGPVHEVTGSCTHCEGTGVNLHLAVEQLGLRVQELEKLNPVGD